MKKLLLFTIVMLFRAASGSAQLATENFDSGLPAAWTMSAASTWSLKPGFGTAGTSCLYTEEMSTNTSVVSYVSPAFNLSGYATMTITFKGAATKTNFLVPNIALSINSGAGKQLLSRWGSGFTQPTTYTLNDVADFSYPLDLENVEWVSCTHMFSVPNATAVSFYFDAEMVNGGYVLLDDIIIRATPKVIAGINESDGLAEFKIYPIPAKNEKISIEGDVGVELSIYDFVGRQLDTNLYASRNDKGFELNNLPSGIYFVRLLSNTQVVERTLVVQ